MKCLSCDCILSDFEATRKYESTGDFIDLCQACFEYVKYDIHVCEREDLKNFEEVDDENI